MPSTATVMKSVGVVIPAYLVTETIIELIRRIPKEIRHIVVVDDACPAGSGDLVAKNFKGSRVRVIRHETNQGVGGAVISGYRELLSRADVKIIVKLDGDGQMNPEDIAALIQPVSAGTADYSKGNRFNSIEDLEQMPKIRIFGNAVLSFLSKVSSGYWQINDPTNGFTAIHTSVLRQIKLEKLRKTFFFESDMLFRLSLIRAVVRDVPFSAKYGTEKSNLRIAKTLREFPARHAVNYLKRIFYQYYLREWSAASFELPLGVILSVFGLVAGIQQWVIASSAGVAATAGQVMIAALPLILGFQLFLAFVNFDIASTPKVPRQSDLGS